MFDPRTPQGVASLRAVWYAVAGFFGVVATAYLALNQVAPEMVEAEKWKIALLTAVAGAVIPAAGRAGVEGRADQSRREAVVAGDVSKVNPGDVAAPLVAARAADRPFRDPVDYGGPARRL